MGDFAAASALRALDDGRYSWEVPEGWQQGKGSFGGLVLGALARALERSEPDPSRRLRVLTGELCAPLLPGSAEVVASVLRRGGAVTNVEARVLQAGQLVARASGLVAAGRPPSALRLEATRPALPPADTVPAVPLGQPPTPRYLTHFELLPVGPLPFCGAKEPVAAGYLRERGAPARGRLDAAAMIGLLDAWWPCALVVEPGPRAMVTVSFTAELLVDPAELDAGERFVYRADLAGAADGYSVELRQLWQGGRLVALNQQVFAAV